jgi:hypothetical protein
MSNGTQIMELWFYPKYGKLCFDKLGDIESYRDYLIKQASTLALAMNETHSEDCLTMLSDINLALNNNLYQCMTLLAESEAENE